VDNRSSYRPARSLVYDCFIHLKYLEIAAITSTNSQNLSPTEHAPSFHV
jgi:hypothetical protein